MSLLRAEVGFYTALGPQVPARTHWSGLRIKMKPSVMTESHIIRVIERVTQQCWFLNLELCTFSEHTHTTLIYFTLNGNLHENSGLFFCVDLIRPWCRLSTEKMLLKCTGEPHLPWLVFAKTFCVNEQKGQEWTCFPEERKAQGCS